MDQSLFQMFTHSISIAILGGRYASPHSTQEKTGAELELKRNAPASYASNYDILSPVGLHFCVSVNPILTACNFREKFPGHTLVGLSVGCVPTQWADRNVVCEEPHRLCPGLQRRGPFTNSLSINTFWKRLLGELTTGDDTSHRSVISSGTAVWP